MNYIIGVDAGGTKTEAIAYDFQGKELVKITTDFGNMIMNKKKAIENILSSIENCVDKLENYKLKSIYLGIAGVEVGENRDIILKSVYEKFKVKTNVYNDGELALYALLKGEEGILTISGTGSICYGIINNKKVVTGGWGHLLGEEGSGYYIAIEALKRMILEEDNGYPKSELTRCILENFNMNDVNEIKKLVYESSKDKIAAIAYLVCKKGEEGEKVSKEILYKAGTELGKITELAWKKLGRPSKVNIAIKGSIITKVILIKNAFMEYINRKIIKCNIVDEEVSSTKGAYYLEMKNNRVDM